MSDVPNNVPLMGIPGVINGGSDVGPLGSGSLTVLAAMIRVSIPYSPTNVPNAFCDEMPTL